MMHDQTQIKFITNSCIFDCISKLYSLENGNFFCSRCESIWGSGITVQFIVFLATRELKPNTGPPVLLMVTFCIFISFGGMSAFRLLYVMPNGGVRYE